MTPTPIKTVIWTAWIPLPAGDVNVRLIDFDARLPQDPTKKFVPNFIKGVPNSAALVRYRVLTSNGDVFAAAAKAPLIPPSASRLNVTVADKSTGAATAVTFGLLTSKNRAAVDTLVIQIMHLFQRELQHCWIPMQQQLQKVLELILFL